MPDHLEMLRTAIPYIRAFKKRVFVIKLSGALCREGEMLRNLVDQIALLDQLGIRVVVVHGGGEQADGLCERLDIPVQRVDGRRITDSGALEAVKYAFGAINTDLVAAFRAGHVWAVGVSGADGGLLQAVRRPPQKVGASADAKTIDFGHVGDVTEVDVDVLNTLLAGGYVPIVAPLACDAQGRLLNINADTIAARIAIAIKAAKYFLLTGVDGILRDVNDARTLESYLDLADLARLAETGVIGGGMLPKVAACRTALLGDVERVHIINGARRDTLLAEVFTNEGSGTLIVREREDEPEES
ncbi:MAG: acetylglutamate kinase [Phycisphaerales bacterium]|nr:acetylglutamate kinase [Phycisphaerales bacterium]